MNVKTLKMITTKEKTDWRNGSFTCIKWNYYWTVKSWNATTIGNIKATGQKYRESGMLCVRHINDKYVTVIVVLILVPTRRFTFKELVVLLYWYVWADLQGQATFITSQSILDESLNQLCNVYLPVLIYWLLWKMKPTWY